MLLEDTSIDQVFRNVRAEVLTQTDGMQRPVEATQLTGQGFYLLRKNYELILDDVWNLINKKKYLFAFDMLSGIMPYLKNSTKAFYYRGVCYAKLEKFSEALMDFNKSLEIDPMYAPSLYGKGLLLISNFDKHDELEKVIKKYIEIRSNMENPDFSYIISAFGILEDSYINNNYDNEIILKMWNDALLKFPNIADLFVERGKIFKELNLIADSCNDYYYALEILVKDSFYSRDKIENLILNNCN